MAFSLVGAANGQQGFYGPYGAPPQAPAYCPPYGACPPPGYAPGFAPGMTPAYPPGIAPTYPPGTRPAPPSPQQRRETTPRDGQDAPPRTDQSRTPATTPPGASPDLGSPTAEQDAAAQQAAADFSSASGATGTPSAPASVTPNAIGDFFGSPGNTVVLSYPQGYLTLRERISGPVLSLDSNGAPTSQPAQVQALVDPILTPGPIFLGTAGNFVGLPGQINGQPVIVPASFISTGNSFSVLPQSPFNVEQEPAITDAIANQPGVSGVAFNSSGNYAEVISGTGNGGGPGGADTAALANVFVDYTYFFQQSVPGNEILIVLPSPGYGGAIGQTKIADNNSARPQDRFFLDFQYFDSTPLATSPVDVKRLTLGFERIFAGPGGVLSSFEFRMPMAATLSSDILANAPTDVNNVEYGNVNMTLKFLIYDAPAFDLAMGARMTVPTADDITLSLTDGTPLIRQKNESFHFIPYLAALYDPGGRVFVHAFANLDFDLNGNPVQINPNGGTLQNYGRLTDQTALFLDGSLGYWLYRNPDEFFYGVAGMAELHYNKTLDNAEEVAAGNIRIGARDTNLDLLNGTLGAHAIFGMTTFTNAVSFPITRSDRVFDWEYRFFVNRNF